MKKKDTAAQPSAAQSFEQFGSHNKNCTGNDATCFACQESKTDAWDTMSAWYMESYEPMYSDLILEMKWDRLAESEREVGL